MKLTETHTVTLQATDWEEIVTAVLLANRLYAASTSTPETTRAALNNASIKLVTQLPDMEEVS